MDSSNAKQKIIAQILCILLSIGMWFYVMNVENPIKSETVDNIAIQISNNESIEKAGLTIAPNQEFYIDLDIDGTAQALRGISSEDFNIEVNISEYALKVGTNKVPIDIKSYPKDIAIKNTEILMIEIVIEEFIEKSIEITSGIAIQSKTGYYVSNPILDEKEVTVSGPKSLVDEVKSVEVRGSEKDIDKDIVKSYDLYPLDEEGDIVLGVRLDKEAVEVAIDSNIGKVIPVRVVTVGELSDGSRLNEIESDITHIEIIGEESIIENIGEIQTEPIDLSKITDSITKEVKLIIPENVNTPIRNTINVTINITKITSKNLNIKVEFVGLDDSLEINNKEIVSNVKINGYEEDLNKVTNENLAIEIDVSIYREAGEYIVRPEVSIINDELNFTIESVEDVTFVIDEINEERLE